MRSLFAGFSKIDMTPKEPMGMDLHGMPRLYRGARGVMDRLYIRTSYLESGNNRFLMIVCDMVLTDVIKPYYHKLMKELAVLTGIPEKYIWIVSTHCHSSIGEEEAPHSPFMEKVITRYLLGLCVKIKKAAVLAVKDRERVKLGYAEAEVEGITGSRRVKLSDGVVVTGWGEGPTPPPGVRIVSRGILDKNVGVVLFKNMKNRVKGAIINYNSHIHLYPMLYFSSEFAGAVARQLDKKMPGIITVYTNGAEGDTSLCSNTKYFPMDKNKWSGCQKREMGRISGIMVRKIMEIKKKIKYEPDVNMRAGETVLKIKNSFKNNAIEKISVVSINKLALVGEVEEMVVEYAINVKKRSPFKSTFIVGMNGLRNFYFATTPEMEEGGYEPKFFIKPGEMDRVVNSTVKLLKKLKRG